MAEVNDYPFEVRPLTEEEGGGYLVSFPDFRECISDGESVEEAVTNGRDALAVVIATLKDLGRPVPAPNSGVVGIACTTCPPCTPEGTLQNGRREELDIGISRRSGYS